MTGVIQHPLVTEKVMDQMDPENKLHFVVRIDADKDEIARELEYRFDATVTNVNTLVTMEGTKKAFVTFEEDGEAEDIASRLGVF
jgi:large subunit ribosomal protein L23